MGDRVQGGDEMTHNSNVFPALVDQAIKNVDSLQAVYSQCIKIWFNPTGKLDVGFSNPQMVKWIRKFRPNVFDESGKKIKEVKE